MVPPLSCSAVRGYADWDVGRRDRNWPAPCSGSGWCRRAAETKRESSMAKLSQVRSMGSPFKDSPSQSYAAGVFGLRRRKPEGVRRARANTRQAVLRQDTPANQAGGTPCGAGGCTHRGQEPQRLPDRYGRDGGPTIHLDCTKSRSLATARPIPTEPYPTRRSAPPAIPAHRLAVILRFTVVACPYSHTADALYCAR